MGHLQKFWPLSLCVHISFAVAGSPPNALRRKILSRQTHGEQILNTSVLPDGWPAFGLCWEKFLPPPAFLGPSISSSTSMSIEFCVEVCDEQNNTIASIVGGSDCHCGNIFNPQTEFDTVDPFMCNSACTGNSLELCGSTTSTDFQTVFQKTDSACLDFRGAYSLTSGVWRLVNLFNDTVGARALPHNAVDLRPPLPRGNLTIAACMNACQNAGFVLAGLEFADECYCGNELENNSQVVPPCNADERGMPCKGNASEQCGGADLLYVYTLPGSGLVPLIPFGEQFDGQFDSGGTGA